MIKQVADALKQRFIERIEASASTPEKPVAFAETGVVLPDDIVWESYAFAAIKAMRKPTLEMLQVAHTAWFHGTPDNPNGNHSAPDNVRPHFETAYRTMIDEALK